MATIDTLNRLKSEFLSNWNDLSKAIETEKSNIWFQRYQSLITLLNGLLRNILKQFNSFLRQLSTNVYEPTLKELIVLFSIEEIERLGVERWYTATKYYIELFKQILEEATELLGGQFLPLNTERWIRRCRFTNQKLIDVIKQLGFSRDSIKSIKGKIRKTFTKFLELSVTVGCTILDSKGDWPYSRFAISFRTLKKEYRMDGARLAKLAGGLEKSHNYADLLAFCVPNPELGINMLEEAISHNKGRWSYHPYDFYRLALMQPYFGDVTPPWSRKDKGKLANLVYRLMMQFYVQYKSTSQNVDFYTNAGALGEKFKSSFPFSGYVPQNDLSRALRINIELVDNAAQERIKEASIVFGNFLSQGYRMGAKFTTSDMFNKGNRICIYTPTAALPFILKSMRDEGILRGNIEQSRINTLKRKPTNTIILLQNYIVVRTTDEDNPPPAQGEEILYYVRQFKLPHQIIKFNNRVFV